MNIKSLSKANPLYFLFTGTLYSLILVVPWFLELFSASLNFFYLSLGVPSVFGICVSNPAVSLKLSYTVFPWPWSIFLMFLLSLDIPVTLSVGSSNHFHGSFSLPELLRRKYWTNINPVLQFIWAVGKRYYSRQLSAVCMCMCMYT